MNILNWIKSNKAIVVIILFALCIVAGFFIGRSSVKIVESVKYVKGKTIHDTIPTERLVPYEVLVPADPVLPMKPETTYIDGKPIYSYMKVDTSAIIADYVKENKYKTELFNNETEGSCTIEANIQYNKIKHLSYEYTPIHKVVTQEKINTLTPFISGRYSTLGSVGLGVGCFYHDVGLEAMYCTDMKTKWVEVGVKIKF